MYTKKNFQTKKELKAAVARRLELENEDGGDPFHPEHSEWLALVKATAVYQPGPFGGRPIESGRVSLEGPHFPAAHTWYAEAVVERVDVYGESVVWTPEPMTIIVKVK